MDEHVRDEVVKALRLAVRSLRSAESALLAPSRAPTPAPVPTQAPAEQKLLQRLRAAALKAKEYEEQDPQSFRVYYETIKEGLLKLVCSRQMLKAPEQAALTLEATDATTAFSHALKAMNVGRLQPEDILRPFVDQPTFKPWGDVDVTTDVVICRYENKGSIEVPLDAEVTALLGACAPGAMERVQSVLTAAGIEWDGDALHVPVHAKWCATIDCRSVFDALASRFIVVERTEASPEWWAAASAAHDVPTAILSVVRAKEPRALCPSSLADAIETWASALPGWYGEESPLILRNACKEDLASLYSTADKRPRQPTARKP